MGKRNWEEWIDRYGIDISKYMKGLEGYDPSEQIEPVEVVELTDEMAEQLGTVRFDCIYCKQETVHSYRTDGYPYCSVCGRRCINIELYCPRCKNGTIHHEYHDVWKCTVCGHTKTHGQADSDGD